MSAQVKHMPNTSPEMTHVPSVPMTVGALMCRPTADVQNYEMDVLPLLAMWKKYRAGFRELLNGVPGTFYAVANFNLSALEPNWCRERLNLFDMKIARCLLGKNWSKRPEFERPSWIAVPEQATFLHYNMVWDVPTQHQEQFFLNAPKIWREMVPYGRFHLQVIGEEQRDAAAVRWYTGKTFHPRWTLDNVVTSTELRRKK